MQVYFIVIYFLPLTNDLFPTFRAFISYFRTHSNLFRVGGRGIYQN